MTRASFFSLSISSSTEETRTPAFLFGGSVTSTTSKSDLISTFRSCGVNFFMTLDFAFIMLGSVAYLGWFSLKSVLCEKCTVNHEFMQIMTRKNIQRIKIKTLPCRILMVVVSTKRKNQAHYLPL